jgi:predicted HicB family RNase H-like nuclease
LKVFLDCAKEKNIPLKKQASGKLVLRLKPEIHQKYKLLASSKNISLNQLINETLEKAV